MSNPTTIGTALRACVAAFMVGNALHASAASNDEADQRHSEFAKLPWQRGPAAAAVGPKATLNIPDQTGLLPESSGGRFLELTGNLPESGTTVLVKNNWWATFSFSESGYVKDDEKLDADGLLSALKKAQDDANAERRKRGMDELFTDGWAVPPHYDPSTRYLEWGLKLHSAKNPEPVINYTMRLLGRRGYESVVLVTTADALEHDVQELRSILKEFSFNDGERYSEFKAGDHVAEFGLGALVLGGAAAAAVKAGWFKGLLAALVAGWKLVAAVVVAALAGLKRLLTGRKSNT